MDILNENHSRAPTVGSYQQTYRDSLSSDVLIKIAQLQPSLTCSARSPFRIAAPLLFDTVEFDIGNENERTEYDVFESTITISAYDADSAIPRVEHVLNACTFSAKTIKVSRYYHQVKGEDYTSIVSLVEKYCPNVESLVLGRQYSNSCIWARLVERYGPQLRSMRYCQITMENFTRFNACKGLLRLCCEFRYIDTLITVLKSVGKTLEELCIGFPRIKEPKDVMIGIQTHCRRLSALSLSYLGVETTYTVLLCSYGPQLVRAEVEHLSLGQLCDVAKVCTNLRTSFVIRFDFGWGGFH